MRLPLAARVLLVLVILSSGLSIWAEDVSPPVLLQYFESKWTTVERRAPDIFKAGYGGLYTPPPGRADQGSFSVGYDPYDRFDLGSAGNPTLYGTQQGFKTTIDAVHRFGGSIYSDYVINHSGYSAYGQTDGNGVTFQQSGGYPGLAITLPYDIDGDYHSAFDNSTTHQRVAGLLDIAQEKNYQYVRSPVPGIQPGGIYGNGNLPGGTQAWNGRIANVPTEANRATYPDRNLAPIMVFDPTTGEQNIPIYPYNVSNPLAGDPIAENAMGYLMRNAQWMVQTLGVDGFRIDAAKHVDSFALNYFDRAVYRSSTHTLLNGQQQQVFSWSEAYDGNSDFLQSFVRKDINPADPGRVGGNRDTMDFPLFFALRDNLSGNGFANSWYNIRSASLDLHDDGLQNGSQGVKFVQSHDDFGPQLNNVALAYVLLQPGNALVYYNAHEFGDASERNFPKDGRSDALGGAYGDALTTLVDIRNTHGRGNFIERMVEKENYAFERQGSALVLLSNRLDEGFDSRTLNVDLPFGTNLVELTGNAKRFNIAHGSQDIPEVITTFNDYFNGPSKVNVRFERNNGGDSGYLVYGLATPQGTLSIAGPGSTLAGSTPTLNGNSHDNAYANATTLLSELRVVTGQSFDVTLNTVAVNLLGSIRERNADGDNALLRLDGGRDINGNGAVDYVQPNTPSYGFENFANQNSPGYFAANGQGAFRQTIDATQLSEGEHFVTVRAFRHRDDGGPAVFSDFRETVYVDRLPPVATLDAFSPITPGINENRNVVVRSTDLTASTVNVWLNLPATITDAQLLTMAASGNQAGQADRDLFQYGFFGVPNGNNVVTYLVREITGNYSVHRVVGQHPTTLVGRGLGDVNFDGAFQPADLSGANSFEQVLYSQNAQFNPAADLNADGLVDDRDLFDLKAALNAGNANAATLAELQNVLLRRGNINGNGVTDAFDIDEEVYRASLGAFTWKYDVNADGSVNALDVDSLVTNIFASKAGDSNLDGVVNMADLATLVSHYHGNFGWAGGNFDGPDFNVGLADLSLLIGNYTGPKGMVDVRPLDAPAINLLRVSGFAVPEPNTWALLLVGLAGLPMARRLASRRRA